jgi:hypothetical protein
MNSFFNTLIFLFTFILTSTAGLASDTLIKLTTEGEVKIVPDLVAFDIAVVCINKELKESHGCVANKSRELSNIFSAHNIDRDDIHSSSISLDKFYRWEKNRQVFKGYRTSVSIEVTVVDLNNLNPLMNDLIQGENLKISGVKFSHSKLSEYQNDAYIQALDNAKTLANRMKDNLEKENIDVIEVSNEKEKMVGQPQLRVSAMEARGGQNDLINVGRLTVHQRLNVHFRLFN